MINGGGELLQTYDTAKELYESIVDRDKLRYPELLEMYYGKGMIYNEIEKTTGVKKCTIRARLFKARSEFKFCLN